MIASSRVLSAREHRAANPSLSNRIVGLSVVDLEKYQVGISFPHFAPNAGVFVQSCFRDW